jgi:hypothetical protein
MKFFKESDAPFNPDVLPLPEFTPEEKAEQIRKGAEVKAALEAARDRGDAEFVIEPGDYRFPNNTGFQFIGYKDMRIEAYGATFWLERPEEEVLGNPIGITVSECENLSLEGLILDFDPPIWIQGKVIDFDYECDDPHIDFVVDEGYPYVDQFGGQLLLYKADGHIMPQDVIYNKNVEKIDVERGLRVFTAPHTAGNKADSFAVGNFNMGVQKFFGDRVILKKGDYVTLPFRRGGSYSVSKCNRCTFKDLYVYASPGMGICESYCEANVYDGVKIKRRPGTSRLLAGMADTFHGLCDTIGPTIRNCEFSHNCDDFINLHGFFSVVLKQVAPNQLIISPMVNEVYTPGMKLDFSDYHSMEDRGSATVVESVEVPEYRDEVYKMMEHMKVHPHHGVRPQLVTLDKEIEVVPETMVDINSLNCSGFVIENNYCHSSMGRALLLSGAKGGIVRNNLWRELDGGVFVFMESHYYMEGQFPRDIIIENNRFEDILGYASRQIFTHKMEQAYITVGLIPPGQYLRKNIIKIDNIKIRGNYIENPPSIPILAVYTNDIEIKDNTVVNPYCLFDAADYKTSPNFYEEDPTSVVYASTCSNVKVSGNKAIFTDDKEKTIPEFTCKYCTGVNE